MLFILVIITLQVLLPAQQNQTPASGAVQPKKEVQTQGQLQAEEQSTRRITSRSLLAQPLKRSWQYLTDGAVALPAVLDSRRVYLALAAGRVVCLDSESGALIWSSEPGGVVSSPIAVGETAVYVATHTVAEDGSEPAASVRAVDKVTGLTIWVHNYPRPFTSPVVLARDRIYAGSADGFFYALSSVGGDVVWKVQTQDVVRGCALATQAAIYFGSDDGALRAVEPQNGQVIWRFQTGGKVVGRPCLDDRAIYFGSDDGYVYSADLPTARLRWKARTGAAVEASPVIAQDHVLVGSFDNFIYCFARANGNRVWKRRLDNRIVAAAIVEGDAVMVSPLRSNYVAVLLQSGGQLLSYYKLDADYEVVAQPSFDHGTLLVPTDRGLVVAAVAPQSPQESALKK